jgi:hypothetical protein
MVAVFRPTAAAAAAPEAELPPADALLLAGALLAGALLVALLAGALVGELLAGALLDELLVELHAASAARPAAAAETTSRDRRRRLGTFSLSCDVIMSFPRFSLFLRLSPRAAASPVSCGTALTSPPCSRRYGRR